MSQTNSSVRSSIAERGFRRKSSGQMGAPVEKPKNTRSALARLFGYFRQEMVLVIILALAVSFSVIAGVLAPRFQSQAIDHLVSRSFSEVSGVLALMILLYALHGAATLLQGYLSARLSQRIIGRLRGDLFHKIVNLPVSYLDSRSHGDIMSRMTNDAENVSTVISQSLSSLFSGILTLIGTIIVMLSFNVPLTLLTCSSVILSIWLTKIISELMHKYYVMRQTLLGQLNGTVEEKITNTKTVIIAEIIAGSMGPLHNMLNNVSFVIVAAFGAWFALRGFISIGVISAFVVYSKQFSRPINELAQLYGQIQTALAGAERIFAVLDEESENKDGDKNDPVREGVIEFKNVNFSYVPGKQVISDFSLKVEAGKKIALVGSTGSGKTTIVNLLMRFYDVDSGSILIDGTDIRDVSTDALRDSIGIVLQDTVLFTDTVRANLKYADPSISDEKMIEAGALSNCDSVVNALSDGYDTVLTLSGASLSQGQRQLITIGRAFLSFPRILILDEATSSVDTRTEKHIQDAMFRLMENRTSLIIAHRLSTIRDADLIVVMDNGRITEMGTHEELLDLKGNYYRLYMTQFAGQAT